MFKPILLVSIASVICAVSAPKKLQLSKNGHYPNALRLIAQFLLILSAMLQGITSQCAVLFQTGFDYPPGSSLTADPSWTPTDSGHNISISAGNLTIAGFAPPSGNSAFLTPGGVGAFHTFQPQTADTWYSFMFNVTSLGSLDSAGTPILGFLQAGVGSAADIWLRRHGSGFDIGGSQSGISIQWNINNGNGWDVGKNYLFAAQYHLVPGPHNDVLNAWLYPDGVIGQNWGAIEGPSMIQTSSNGADRDTINGIYVRQGLNSANVIVDELRVGQSFADVTPVPEPSAVTVLALGCGLLGSCRRFTGRVTDAGFVLKNCPRPKG